MDLAPAIAHRRLAAAAPAAYADGPVDIWQAAARERLRRRLGAWPTEPCPLQPRTLWRREHPLGSIEKVAFACEPGCDAVAYACRPAAPPRGWVICLQGHSTGMHHSIAVAQDEATSTSPPGDRDFALGCLRRGWAALCLEQRGFGERREPDCRTATGCDTAAPHALLLGRTLIGERVWDVDRAIDYLLQRGDADPARIGVLGQSGGGTTAMFAIAMLPRLAFAVPACCFCRFRDSILAMPHCICNYVPGLVPAFDMADILALAAPRPVVVVAGAQDDIFPIAGTRGEFARLQRVYAAAGAPDRCRLVVGEGGHDFYAEPAWRELTALMG